MLNLFDRYRTLSCLSKRFFLNFLVFTVANVMYRAVFETVGYMYNVNLSVSILNLAISVIFLSLLTFATNFKNIIYQHAFDVCILGMFLPIAVIACQIDWSFRLMLYPFASICIISLAVRLSEASAFIKGMNKRTGHGMSFSKLQKLVIVIFSIFIVTLFSGNLANFSLDLVDIYLRTYEIRADQQGAGFLGYFIGWFILVFFPILLCEVHGRLKFAAPLLALIGATLVFQAFAVKVIFLNFFLIGMFAFIYRKNNFYKKYLPQVFFLFLFFITYLMDLLAHPLLDRFFYLVGLNSIFYLDFFSQNSLRFFEGTKLDFGISNYGMDVGFQIDKAYYEGLGTNQSAGFLPTMYSDLGIIGLLLASLVLGGIMALIKSMQSSSDSFTYLVMISLAFALMNHSFNMLFLSNGLAFIIISSVILRRQK